MYEDRRITKLLKDDQPVSDFEFTQRLHQNDFTQGIAKRTANTGLVWEDML